MEKRTWYCSGYTYDHFAALFSRNSHYFRFLIQEQWKHVSPCQRFFLSELSLLAVQVGDKGSLSAEPKLWSSISGDWNVSSVPENSNPSLDWRAADDLGWLSNSGIFVSFGNPTTVRRLSMASTSARRK